MPSVPGCPSDVSPDRRSAEWPTTSAESLAPSAGSVARSLSSSTEPAGLVTAARTSTVTSSLARTNAVNGTVVRRSSSSLSTVTRTVPRASAIPSETVKSTR